MLFANSALAPVGTSPTSKKLLLVPARSDESQRQLLFVVTFHLQLSRPSQVIHLFQTAQAFATRKVPPSVQLFTFKRYLPSLPLFCLPACQSGSTVFRGSHVSQTLLRFVRRQSPCLYIAYAYPVFRFQCGEIPKPVTYPHRHIINLPISSLRLSTATWKQVSMLYTRTPHSDLLIAFRRLSYPRTPDFAGCRQQVRFLRLGRLHFGSHASLRLWHTSRPSGASRGWV